MDEPNLLLLDEPVSGIDQNGMELFFKTMDYLKKHYDLAIILISHDLDYVARYADHVVLLDKTVLRQGTVKEVYESSEFEQIFSAGKEETVYNEKHRKDTSTIIFDVKGVGTITIKVYVDDVLKRQTQMNLNSSDTFWRAE